MARKIATSSFKFLFWFILVSIFTPWFWFWTPSKNQFKSELNKDFQEARLEVIWERGEVGNSTFDRLFVNWPLVFLRRRLLIMMENLDFGNYFFAGHPRARLGVEEKQKFFFFHFLLLIIGFTHKKIKKCGKPLLIYFFVSLIASFIFKWRDFYQTIPFSFPFLIVITFGLEKVFSWPKKYRFVFLGFSVLEIISFIFFFSKGFLR